MRIGEVANGAGVTTTDALTHTILTYALTNNQSGVYMLFVTAKNTATNKSGNTIVAFAAQNVAGAVTIFPSSTDVLSVIDGSDASMSGISVTVTQSGNNVVIQGTGIEATNILWTACISPIVKN